MAELDLVKVILRSNLKREDIETLRKTVEPAAAYISGTEYWKLRMASPTAPSQDRDIGR